MPISQYEFQSGHCFLEEISQSSKISVLPMWVTNFFDSSLNLTNLFSLFQVLQERLLVRDLFFAIRVLLFDCRMEYAWDSTVNVAAAGFLRNFPIRFGGQRIFLLLHQVDPAVHFANSALQYHTRQPWRLVYFMESSSVVFMHTAFSIQIAGSVFVENNCAEELTTSQSGRQNTTVVGAIGSYFVSEGIPEPRGTGEKICSVGSECA